MPYFLCIIWHCQYAYEVTHDATNDTRRAERSYITATRAGTLDQSGAPLFTLRRCQSGAGRDGGRDLRGRLPPARIPGDPGGGTLPTDRRELFQRIFRLPLWPGPRRVTRRQHGDLSRRDVGGAGAGWRHWVIRCGGGAGRGLDLPGRTSHHPLRPGGDGDRLFLQRQAVPVLDTRPGRCDGFPGYGRVDDLGGLLRPDPALVLDGACRQCANRLHRDGDLEYEQHPRPAR